MRAFSIIHQKARVQYYVVKLLSFILASTLMQHKKIDTKKQMSNTFKDGFDGGGRG